MTARKGSGMALAGPFHSRPQAQKMTPKATAITDAMTMSMVRQRLFMVTRSQLGPGEDARRTRDGPGRGAAGGSTELPALALPRSGSRVCGRGRTLSAVRSPVGCVVVSQTLTPPGLDRHRSRRLMWPGAPLG